MRALVVYHSITGNTKRVAGALAKGLTSSGIRVEVKPLDEVDPQKLKRYDLICIGTPVHYFRPSAKVRGFLKKMPKLQGKLGVAFSTHGGFGPCLSLVLIKRALSERGVRILGGITTLAANYHHRPLVLHRDRPNRSDLQRFEEFGAEVGRKASLSS